MWANAQRDGHRAAYRWRSLFNRQSNHDHTTIGPYGPFCGTTQASQCQKRNWTLWCKGRLTEANTPTIRLGATPSGLTSAHLHIINH